MMLAKDYPRCGVQLSVEINSISASCGVIIMQSFNAYVKDAGLMRDSSDEEIIVALKDFFRTKVIPECQSCYGNKGLLTAWDVDPELSRGNWGSNGHGARAIGKFSLYNLCRLNGFDMSRRGLNRNTDNAIVSFTYPLRELSEEKGMVKVISDYPGAIGYKKKSKDELSGYMFSDYSLEPVVREEIEVPEEDNIWS